MFIVCSAAQAQQASFTGPALALGVGAADNRVEYGGFLAGQTGKDNNAVVKLDGSYGIDLSPQWVATLGMTYDVNKSDFGTVSYVDVTTFDVSAKMKKHYSLYVAPGFRVAPQWLVYGKLAWHHESAESNDTQFGSASTTHKSLGWGKA